MKFKFKLLVAALPLLVAQGLQPSHETARQRGPEIFNAVHDAMRQWGSSLHHNGMSTFLATVPENTLLYHGNNSPESPIEPDWLAYEIEHAEQFARDRPHHGNKTDPPKNRHDDVAVANHQPQQHQRLLGHEETQLKRGWLHAYRTTRPLRLLYADGMSGAKSRLGTLDFQDYLLRGTRSIVDDPATTGDASTSGGGPMDERKRAIELCALCKAWNLDGVIRMEAGFEIIKCDFTDGLEETQALPRRVATPRPPGGHWRLRELEYVRGVAERYHGIGASRTSIDYSSMVSAFFFPVDLTNTDPSRLDLPRLSNVSDEELEDIRAYLVKTIRERQHGATGINWQGVSDLIVGRYADRIEFMANKVHSPDVMTAEVNFLLDLFIDYSEDDHLSRAIRRCTDFYLVTISPTTEADNLIFSAFRAVTSQICTALFKVREIATKNPVLGDQPLDASREVLSSLIEVLGWSRFMRCPACGVDEVCFIPMWPKGNKRDYNNPRCIGADGSGHDGESYWGKT